MKKSLGYENKEDLFDQRLQLFIYSDNLSCKLKSGIIIKPTFSLFLSHMMDMVFYGGKKVSSIKCL